MQEGKETSRDESVLMAANVFSFAPEEIIQDELINLRPFSHDLGDLEELAESIKKHGREERMQLEPVIVRVDAEGKPHLVAGKRRVTAISLINSGLEEGDEQWRVKATVTLADSDEAAWGAAWAENKDREGMSPMDIAINIQTLRAMREWAGKAGTKEVAAYLGVSSGFVTTHEKLLGLPAEVQAKVHEGKLSVDAALKAVVDEGTAQQAGRKAEEVQAEVLAKAEELAAKEKEKLAASGKKSKTGKKGKGGSEVKGRHVQQAKRGVAGALDAKKRAPARSKAEIVELLESEFDGPLFGFENGPIRLFVKTLLKWIGGEGADRGVVERFKVMVEGVERGTPEPPKKDQPAKKAKVNAVKKVKANPTKKGGKKKLPKPANKK